MNKRCSICNHPSRTEIDRGLLAGASRRPLADQYGLSTAALSRHTHYLRLLLSGLALTRRFFPSPRLFSFSRCRRVWYDYL